jgi:hypothetical protein
MMAQQYHEEAVEEQQEEQGLSSGVSGLFNALIFVCLRSGCASRSTIGVGGR